MREQYKDSLWTPCKTLQYRKVFANAMVEETGIPCFSCGECQVKYSTLFVKNRRAVYIAKIVATSFLHCVSSDGGIAYSSSECAPEPWMPRLQRAGIPMRVTKEVSEQPLCWMPCGIGSPRSLQLS